MREFSSISIEIADYLRKFLRSALSALLCVPSASWKKLQISIDRHNDNQLVHLIIFFQVSLRYIYYSILLKSYQAEILFFRRNSAKGKQVAISSNVASISMLILHSPHLRSRKFLVFADQCDNNRLYFHSFELCHVIQYTNFILNFAVLFTSSECSRKTCKNQHR